MRKWQVDTVPYVKRRDAFVKSIIGFPPTPEARMAQADYMRIVRNFDNLVTTLMDLNYRYRYQERTPQGYRKLANQLEVFLSEIDQLTTVYLLTFSE